MSLLFENWLLKQYKRDDAIGDLSKDYKLDVKFNGKENLTRRYLHSKNACDNAIKALIKAKLEYRKFKRKNKINAD